MRSDPPVAPVPAKPWQHGNDLPESTPDQAHQADKPVPAGIEDWLTAAVMGALALITLANVLVRYFSNLSFAWTEELSVFLMIVLTLLGSAAAARRKRHIRIELFCQTGSATRHRLLANLSAISTALFFLLVAVLSARLAWDDYRYGETSPGIGIPQWWYSIWLPVLSMLIAWRAARHFGRHNRQP